MPGVSAAKFAFGDIRLNTIDQWTLAAQIALPPGSWVFDAVMQVGNEGGYAAGVRCELRHGSADIGGAGVNHIGTPVGGFGRLDPYDTISANGGAIISDPANATVGVWCTTNTGPGEFVRTQLMATQVGGFL